MDVRCRVGTLFERMVRLQDDEAWCGLDRTVGGQHDEFGLDVECVGLLCQDIAELCS